MKRISALLRRLTIVGIALLSLAAAPIAATAAEETGYALTDTYGLADDDVSVTSSVTYWEEPDGGADAAMPVGTASRHAETALFAGEARTAPSRAPIASYGPFHLISNDTVEMVGTVDSQSPAQFAALMAAHRGVRRLVMVECPGSVDEAANHLLARAVRQAGLATHVPDGGSVRSGAVDLFLAGTERTAGRSAEFAVHSWRDEDGYEARDFPVDADVHQDYLSYYREMGMSDRAARAFYALTNSVSFDEARSLSATDMAVLGLARITAG